MFLDDDGRVQVPHGEVYSRTAPTVGHQPPRETLKIMRQSLILDIGRKIYSLEVFYKIYIHTYIHTYIHAYIHTHTSDNLLESRLLFELDLPVVE